eukprot:gene8695-biopygen11012
MLEGPPDPLAASRGPPALAASAGGLGGPKRPRGSPLRPVAASLAARMANLAVRWRPALQPWRPVADSGGPGDLDGPSWRPWRPSGGLLGGPGGLLAACAGGPWRPWRPWRSPGGPSNIGWDVSLADVGTNARLRARSHTGMIGRCGEADLLRGVERSLLELGEVPGGGPRDSPWGDRDRVPAGKQVPLHLHKALFGGFEVAPVDGDVPLQPSRPAEEGDAQQGVEERTVSANCIPPQQTVHT